MVFAKFSCGTYVIVVLNSDIVALIKQAEFFVFRSVIFSMVLLNLSIFLCAVTEFGIPLPPAILIFEHAYNSTTRPASIV